MPGPDALATPTPVSRIRGARTIAGDLASVSGARLLSAGISVATVILTTRILRPAQYTLVAYVNVAAGLMFTATSAWTAAAVTRYGREELERTGQMNTTSWNRLLITLPMIVLSIVVIVGLRAAGALPSGMTWTFTGLAVASGLLLILSEHTITLLEAGGRMRLTAGLLAARNAASTLVLLAIFLSGVGQTPLAIVSLSTVALGCVTALMANRVWRGGLWPPAIDRIALRRMLAFSVPLIAFSASQYVIQSADLIVLRAHGLTAGAGIYAIAYQGYTVLQAVPTTITVVLTPLFVSLRTGAREELIGRYIDRVVSQLTFLGVAAAAVAAPVSSLAIRVVYGPGYGPAARPFAILLVALLMYGCSSLTAPVLVLAERSRIVAIINIAAAVLNVALDIVFVDLLGLGIVGPAIATAISLGVIAIGYSVAASRVVGASSSGAPWYALVLGASVTPLVLHSGAIAYGESVVVAGILIAAISRWRPPFAAQDVDLIAKLDLPARIKRPLLHALERRT